MTIYIGADHRGFELKSELKPWLEELGVVVVDLGAATYDPADDYPGVAIAVAEAVASAADTSLGIIICGSGVGANIAANKVNGVRSTQGWSVDQVEHAKQHDNINVLSLASNYFDLEQTKELVSVFIDAPFLGEERLIRRIKQISDYEQS